ncbi:MAG: hypothetical protein PHY64_13635, partial [Eubacteriales bacterium]|nr:hypothetical protein [Eubacteriales bacterium]
MSISGIKGQTRRQPLKTAFIYLGISALCFAIDQIYALYGHGVHSPAMTLMFLYPLIGGALMFTLLSLSKTAVEAKPRYRVYYNRYNSGIATLTAGSLLKG